MQKLLCINLPISSTLNKTYQLIYIILIQFYSSYIIFIIFSFLFYSCAPYSYRTLIFLLNLKLRRPTDLQRFYINFSIEYLCFYK